MDLERHLNLAPSVSGVRYFSELRRSEHDARIAEAGMIQEVEKFTTYFHMPSFEERPALKHRKVDIVETVSTKNVAAGVSKCVLGRDRECGGVEPLLWRPAGDGIRVANQIRILRIPAGNSSDVGGVAAQEGHERQAAVVGDNAGQVPAGNTSIEHAVPGLTRHGINKAGHEILRDVEPG